MDVNELSQRCDYLQSQINSLEINMGGIVSVLEHIQEQLIQIISIIPKVESKPEITKQEVK